jgi:hypothetical protein
VSNEVIDWTIWNAIVVRVQDWKNNSLVGDYRGCVVALIPYQSEEGKQNALSIAEQIVAANPNCVLRISEEVA